MSLARKAAKPAIGSATPRIGPPRPLRHDLAEYRRVSGDLGVVPMPWQDTAAVYITARGPDHLLYRDVAIVVARQQGKTTLVKPLIVQRLKAGRHIMHIAQVRELPRIMFEQIADAIEASDPGLFPKRRGKIIWPRRGAGSESIVLTNGGSYRIAAAITGSARGHSSDDLIIDELREMESFDVINAAKYTQRFSVDPQTIYLSNAGTDASVVLNSLRARGAEDPSLAYLEWSADPDYDADDIRGWVQANPAIGHYPQVLRDLEKDYLAAKLGGNMNGFETESLCRWVTTMRQRLVDEFSWRRCAALTVDRVRRPSFGISVDPSGTRASVVMGWRQDDKTVALKELFDVEVAADGLDDLGVDAMAMARKMGAQFVGYDDLTDRALARHFLKKSKAVIGKDYTNASMEFVHAVERNEIRFIDADHITEDLKSTSRKDNDETGTYQAVKSKDDLPITAALAAIRAFWLASGSLSTGRPRFY